MPNMLLSAQTCQKVQHLLQNVKTVIDLKNKLHEKWQINECYCYDCFATYKHLNERFNILSSVTHPHVVSKLKRRCKEEFPGLCFPN